MAHRVTLIRGDWIGPETCESVQKIISGGMSAPPAPGARARYIIPFHVLSVTVPW